MHEFGDFCVLYSSTDELKKSSIKQELFKIYAEMLESIFFFFFLIYSERKQLNVHQNVNLTFVLLKSNGLAFHHGVGGRGEKEFAYKVKCSSQPERMSSVIITPTAVQT